MYVGKAPYNTDKNNASAIDKGVSTLAVDDDLNRLLNSEDMD